MKNTTADSLTVPFFYLCEHLIHLPSLGPPRQRATTRNIIQCTLFNTHINNMPTGNASSSGAGQSTAARRAEAEKRRVERHRHQLRQQQEDQRRRQQQQQSALQRNSSSRSGSGSGGGTNGGWSGGRKLERKNAKGPKEMRRLLENFKEYEKQQQKTSANSSMHTFGSTITPPPPSRSRRWPLAKKSVRKHIYIQGDIL